MIGSRYSMFFAAGMATGANALVDSTPVFDGIAFSVPGWVLGSIAGLTGAAFAAGGVVLCCWLAKKCAQEQEEQQGLYRSSSSSDSSNPSNPNYHSI